MSSRLATIWGMTTYNQTKAAQGSLPLLVMPRIEHNKYSADRQDSRSHQPICLVLSRVETMWLACHFKIAEVYPFIRLRAPGTEVSRLVAFPASCWRIDTSIMKQSNVFATSGTISSISNEAGQGNVNEVLPLRQNGKTPPRCLLIAV